MAPIVHGLEEEWGQRVDFLYLDIADSANAAAMARYGFRATPHFFLIAPDGAVDRTWQGPVHRDTLGQVLQRAAGAIR
jgi:hypothetical protein